MRMQDPTDLLTGSANGYVAGQIIYDAFLVRRLQTPENAEEWNWSRLIVEKGNVCCACL